MDVAGAAAPELAMSTLGLYLMGAVATAFLFVMLPGPATRISVGLFYINAVALLLYESVDPLGSQGQVRNLELAVDCSPHCRRYAAADPLLASDAGREPSGLSHAGGVLGAAAGRGPSTAFSVSTKVGCRP
jgi:hypothetical protein